MSYKPKVLEVAAGGTGATTLTSHGVLIGSGTSAVAATAAGTAGQVLLSGGGSADPSFSTATFPATATSTGTILRADGTNWVATTSTYPNTNAVSTLLYASATNVMSALATANSAIYNTNSSGVPTITASPTVTGTITAATFTATANINLPTSTASVGVIYMNSIAFIHAKGTNSTYLGNPAGNLSNTGSGNTGIGYFSLVNVSSAQETTCVGAFSGAAGVVSGTGCTYMGYGAGYMTTTPSYNTGIGNASLRNVTTGGYNTAIGYNSGQQYTSSEASNVMIANAGTTGESNVMRIGTAGSGNGQVNTCYIAGISGVAVTGAAVLCSTAGLLGTVVSSERYKENISDLDENLSILSIRPVKFNFKNDEKKEDQYGFIAEEVHENFPYLCLYDDEKRPESVKYHEICTFLLHEIRKLDKKVSELESKMR